MTNKEKQSVEEIMQEYRQQPFSTVAEDKWTEENRDGYLKACDEIELWLFEKFATLTEEVRAEREEVIGDLEAKIETIIGFLNVDIDPKMKQGIEEEWEDYKRQALTKDK